jgi:hypothetical protein
MFGISLELGYWDLVLPAGSEILDAYRLLTRSHDYA